MPLHRGLYAITSQTVDTQALLAWAAAIIDGGAVWLQYRDKGADHDLRFAQARALATLCRRHGVRLIVNDDVALAQSSGADGVHLGEHDPAIADARHVLGADSIIGVSCYDDSQRAIDLAAAGADYLAFGAFFPSDTKPGAHRASPTLLSQARSLGRPLVAIGGITPDNGGELVRAGADLLAVIGGLACAPDQARVAARRYSGLFHAFPSETDAER